MKKKQLEYITAEEDFIVVSIEQFIEIYMLIVGASQPELWRKTTETLKKAQRQKKKRIRIKKTKQCFQIMYNQLEDEIEIKKNLEKSFNKAVESNENTLEKLSKD